QDMKKANRVIIVSPYLNMDTIKYWRSLSPVRNAGSFTIIYDIGKEQEGLINGIVGSPQIEIQKKVEWRRYDKLHAKLYYFGFGDGYAFYHGSANFTDRGIGESMDRSNY